MYSPYGLNVANKVKKYHLLNGGVSRFEKFKIWHKEYLNIDLSEKDITDMSIQFSDLVLENVIKSNQIDGSFKFIKSNFKKFKFWIITGTPTPEIKFILDIFFINKFFIGVYGSPNKKKYWTEYLIKKNNLKRKKTLFIGDALTDHEAANFSHIHFALRISDYNREQFKNIDVFKFSKFSELNSFLK